MLLMIFVIIRRYRVNSRLIIYFVLSVKEQSLIEMSMFPSELIPLISVAKNLPFSQIISLCRVNKQFNQAICNNKAFWRQVAEERLTTLVQPDIAQTKRALQVYEHAFDLMAIAREDVERYLSELSEGGYDIAVLNLLRHHPGRSYYRHPASNAVAAAEGAAQGGYDNLIQGILQLIKNEDNRRLIESRVVVAAGRVGNIDIMRKYAASFGQGDISDLIDNTTEYLGHHPDRTDLIDFLVEVIGDDYDNQRDAVLSSVRNDIRPLFDLYYENTYEEDIPTFIQMAVIQGRKDYFDVMLPRINNLNRLVDSLILALKYDRLDMIDDILALVREMPDVIRQAFKIIRDDNNTFISFAALEKILPYLTIEAKHLFLKYLRRKKKRAVEITSDYTGEPGERQQRADRFLKDYEAIKRALAV